MPNPLYRQNILSVSDLSIEQLQCLLDTALRLKRQPRGDLLEGRLIASCFFEPSTRTRLSFETAVQRLGGKVIGFADGRYRADYLQLCRCDCPTPPERRRGARVGRIFARARD